MKKNLKVAELPKPLKFREIKSTSFAARFSYNHQNRLFSLLRIQ